MHHRFLLALVLTLATAGILTAQSDRMTLRAADAPFFHGVASGDPTSDRVMIWTRVTPDATVPEIEVEWQVSTDPGFTSVVNFGRTVAVDTNDYTVKLDICGLQPATHYYYMFRALGQNSIVGRTKTAPDSSAAPGALRFGVTSCSSYEHGYFNAYESMAARNDLDAVIHLGDYIYEYATGGYSANISGREHEPVNEIITLSDYRTRISHYRLDDDLLRAHQLYPFITTWDDHESANDAWSDGAQNHNGGEGPWNVRLANSTRAYREWMPLRNPDPVDDRKIWRSLRYGELMDLLVIDSRIWDRDEQDLLNTTSSSRRLLGDDQYNWLCGRISDPSTKWKVIANQVMMAPLEVFGVAVNADQWDGYQFERNRLIDCVEQNNAENTVVLTGDIHTAWASNVPGNTWTNAMVEFVSTSTTSPGFPLPVGAGIIQSLNPHIEYTELVEHGYYVLTVEDTEAQADFTYVEIDSDTYTDDLAASWKVVENTQSVVDAGAPKPVGPTAFAPPASADQTLPMVDVVLGVSLTTAENAPVDGCVTTVPSEACPGPSVAIIDSADFGVTDVTGPCFTYTPATNYFGPDSFTLVTCDGIAPCDTTLVTVTVTPVFQEDTVVYDITSDSTLVDCIPPNDLTGPVDTASFAAGGAGGFTLVDDTCFSYVPDIAFNGTDTVTVVHCDALGICDTTTLYIIVSAPSRVDTIRLAVPAGVLFSDCHSFDDLTGAVVSSSGTSTDGTGQASFFADTCFSYLAPDTAWGFDTIVLTACDTAVPPSCDTVVYILEVGEEPTSIDDVRSMAFFGAYPNPANDHVVLQYALFLDATVHLDVVDARGRTLLSDDIEAPGAGLHYARLDASSWSSGVYVIRLTAAGRSYTRRLIKR